MNKRAKVVVPATVVLATLAVPAFAAWVATGSGKGASTANVLNAPGAGSITAKTATSLTLTWSAPSTGVTPVGYFIYRNGTLVSGASGCDATTRSASTAVTCTDTGLTASTAYSYQVQALAGTKWVSAKNTAFGDTTTAAGDTTPPQLQSLTMLDNNTNGKADRLVMVFDENLNASSTTAGLSLANAPSGATISSMSISAATATVTLSEGAGAANTAVGTFRVSLSGAAGGLRDSTGNLSSFANATPTDGAAPVPVSFTDTNGANDGTFQAGDTFTVTYSEPVLTTWTAPDSTQTLVLTDASPRDLVTFPAKFGGGSAVSTGDNGYISSGTATFATTLTQPTTSSLRTTLGACTGTGCANLGTGATQPFTFAPSTAAITDSSSNQVTGTVTTSIRLF
jgi:hypothetical protein